MSFPDINIDLPEFPVKYEKIKKEVIMDNRHLPICVTHTAERGTVVKHLIKYHNYGNYVKVIVMTFLPFRIKPQVISYDIPN